MKMFSNSSKFCLKIPSCVFFVKLVQSTTSLFPLCKLLTGDSMSPVELIKSCYRILSDYNSDK